MTTEPLSASAYLRQVFDVVIAQAEHDPQFAAALLASLGRSVAPLSAPNAPQRKTSQKEKATAPTVDLNALHGELGREGLEARLLTRGAFTVPQLRALIDREGFNKPPSKSPKADLAFWIARAVARRNGDATLDAA